LTAVRRLLLVAACALIDNQRRVLIAKRPPGRSLAGLWEFPGGKLEPGEAPEDAVVREMREELAVTTDRLWLTPLTFASHAYPDFHLFMPLFVCHRWQGDPRPLEEQEIAWVDPSRLCIDGSPYPMPPADAPLIPALAAYLR
jgi:8-oxo-dGTP diphosphatase